MMVVDSENDMDLLLVNPYSIALDRNERKYKKPFPPLGILYLASYLRDRGFEVSYVDSAFERGPTLGDLSNNPDWIGLFTTSVARAGSIELIRKAKDNGFRIMVGGPDASMDPTPYLEAGADVAVIGEGELTAEELIKDPDRDDINGTALLEEGRVRLNPPRKMIDDLDRLPQPARDIAPIDSYLGMWKRYHGISMLNIISSRGCPYGCKWCCRPVFGKTFRQRSVDSVVTEARDITQDYRPDRLWFSDDVLPMKEEWVLEFSEAMAQENIKFECLSRVDLITENIAEALKKGGCQKVHLGVESGSQTVLDSMGKGTTVSQIRRASESLKGAGIDQDWFLMYGYPSERTEDIISTMRLTQELLPQSYGISIAYPMKGTEFYEEVKDRLVGHDWSSTMQNELIFEREYGQMYYDAARLWTHGVVRSSRAVRGMPLSGAWDRLTVLSARLVLWVLGGGK